MSTITPAFILGGFGVAEPTPGDTIDPSWLPSAGGATWGGITGALASQTDLQGALDGKATAAQGALAASALQPAGNGSALTGLTKTQVGLGNVDNTADAAKPVSTAQQTALDARQLLPLGTLVVPTTGQTQTFTTTKAWQIIACDHAATIAAQTFVFPTDANSVIGQELRIFSRSIITTVTLTLNGNTIRGTALTTLPANGNVAWRKLAANTWMRIQ